MTQPFDWNLPRLNPTLQALGIAAVALGLTFGAGYWQGIKHQSGKTEQAEARANVAKGESNAIKRQANAKDAEIAAKDAGLKDARAQVARSDREVERMRKLIPRHDPVPSEGENTPRPVPPAVDLAPLVSALEQANSDKAYLIQGLETKISDLVISRDLHMARADASERESLNLRAANAAKEGLLKAERWKGRIEGFAVGFAGGYATGRLQ